MASVCVTPSGAKQIRLGPNECPTVPASKRPRLGLGKVNARQAASIC